MNKKFGRLLMAFGVVLLIVAGALFLFRTALVAHALTLMLEKQGARQVSLDVRQINATQIHIGHLNLVLPRDSSLVALKFKNLTVSFAPEELIHGQVKDIALEQLILRQSIAPNGEVVSSEPFQLADLLTQLSSDWHNRLPFRRARIATLRLYGKDLPPALDHHLILTVVRTNSGAKVTCRSASSSPSGGVDLSMEKNGGTLALQAVAAEAGELNVTLVGAQIEGSFVLDAARLNPLLVILGRDTVQAFDQLGFAPVSGSFAVNLKRWPLFDMQAQLATKGLTRGATRLKGLDLKFEFQADASVAMEQALQRGCVRFDIEQLRRADSALTGVKGQFGITAAPNGNYRLKETSALRIAEFRNPETSFQSASFPLSGTLSLTENKQFRMQLTGASLWRFREFKHAGVSIREAAVRAALNLHLAQREGRITFPPGFDVTLDQLKYSDVRVQSLSLRPSATAELRAWLDDGLRWSLESSRWLINTPLVENSRMQVSSDEFVLSLRQFYAEDHGVFLTGKVQAQRIAMAVRARKIGVRDLTLNFSMSPQGIEGAGDFLMGLYPEPVSYSVEHELATGRGMFRLTTLASLELSERFPLSSLLGSWSFPGDAVNGRINMSIDATWTSTRALSATADIRLVDITGTWQEIKFSGLSLAHRFRLWPVFESMNQAQLTLDLIVASGIPITETMATFSISQAGQTLDAPFRVELEEGHFSLLGSTFVLQPFTYNSNAAGNQLRIEAARLDLAHLAPLLKTEGLEINGLVEAVLPLELGRAGVEIISGTIRQNGPGLIVYHPPNPDMLRRAGMPDIAIRALENFHYDNLEIGVTYQTDGQLDLAIRLHGKSPTAGTERPFHINLNVEQNLLSLLESLRYSAVFERKIEEYMQKKR